LVKGSLNCSNKRPGPLQKGDKNQKIWRGYWKVFPWEPVTDPK
jgi:hypothetical protein